MSEYTLLMLEIGGIQDFIFGSNSLQINSGASRLVRAVSTTWIIETLNAQGLVHNIQRHPLIDPGPFSLDQEQIRLHDPGPGDANLDVEAIYLGGGNALLLFTNQQNAQIFARNISLRTLLDAPGLKTVIAQTAVDWNSDPLPDKVESLRHELSRQNMRPWTAAKPSWLSSCQQMRAC